MRRILVAVAVLALPSLAHASDELSGFVTALHPPAAIQLNGRDIHLTPTTQLCIWSHENGGDAKKCPSAPAASSTSFVIGQELDVRGKFDRASHALIASKITLNAPSSASVGGTAIIDLIPSTQPAGPAERIVRADGYLLRITPETKLNLAPPLKSLADVSTNQWIQYSGVQQTGGIVVLNYAGVGPNNVSTTEDKLRKNTEYDPAAVPDDAHQSALSKAFIGTDYKRVPPWHDDAMQARVERIGNSLVPAYQRALPDTVPKSTSASRSSTKRSYGTPSICPAASSSFPIRSSNECRTTTSSPPCSPTTSPKTSRRIRFASFPPRARQPPAKSPEMSPVPSFPASASSDSPAGTAQ